MEQKKSPSHKNDWKDAAEFIPIIHSLVGVKEWQVVLDLEWNSTIKQKVNSWPLGLTEGVYNLHKHQHNSIYIDM